MTEDGTTRRAAERDPGSVADVTDTGQTFVAELLRREGQGEETPPSARPSRMCLLVVALACSALLSGAVIASTAALAGPRTKRTAPSSPAPAAIAGAEAMRPDLIDASVGFPPLPASDTSDPAAASSPTEDSPHRILDPEVDPILSTVTAFYRHVTATPRQAFALLGPQMCGSGWKDFQNAWASVRRVTVDNIRLDGPNAVLVTTSLERTDGSVLHTLQRVLVTPGAEPLITDARLLSASRS